MNYPMQPATATRPLGDAERMFWLLNQNCPVHFAVSAQIEGVTTTDAWLKALDLVQRRHLNFSVKIGLDKDGDPVFHRIAGARIPMRVVVGDGLEWESEIEKELATPFDAQQAPLVRAVLLHQAKGAMLILVAHHSIADGKSLVFAIRDILRALSGRSLAPLSAIPSLDFAYSDHGAPEENAGFGRSAKPFVFREHDDSVPRVRSHTLTRALTNKLRRRSRKEDATIQCALITAAAEAARRSSGELAQASIRVSCPIDFRSIIGALDEVAPLGGGVGISMEPSTQTSFWETARVVKSVIDHGRTPEALANLMARLRPFMSARPTVADVAAFWRERLGYDINVSNLGEIPIETRIGDLRLQSVSGPSILIGFEGEQGLGVATVNGALNLLHTSYKPLPIFLESIEQSLKAACL